MVLFGEQLASLQHEGWETNYIQYNELKKVIAKLIQERKANDEAAAKASSVSFYDQLEEQVNGVNAFVVRQLGDARARFTALTADHKDALGDVRVGAPLVSADGGSMADALRQLKSDGNTTAFEHLRAARDLERDLDALRRFVGTNVIAATKIVKKHDKNVAPALRKRDALAALVRAQSFFSGTELPTLATEVDVFVDRALASVYPGGVVPAGAKARKMSDANEEEEGLKSLPQWLLAGASKDAAANAAAAADEEQSAAAAAGGGGGDDGGGADYTAVTIADASRFISTFLSTWRFKKVTYDPDEATRVFVKGDAVEVSRADGGWSSGTVLARGHDGTFTVAFDGDGEEQSGVLSTALRRASGAKGLDADARAAAAIDEVWDVDFSDPTLKDWATLTTREKAATVARNSLKVSIILIALYLFICSLSFLATGFRLVAGKDAATVFSNNLIFDNPVAGLMVGILATVLVQSSSTSTSIVITMVGADLLTVEQAIPIIMGANIGTSVTSTIVAMGQINDRNEFRRAFAAATVHDMFNFLSVLLLLPIEAATGYLYKLATYLVPAGYKKAEDAEKLPDMLKVLTKPFTKWIVQIDKKIISKITTYCNLKSTKYDVAQCDKYGGMTLMKAPKECAADAGDDCEGVSYLFDGMYNNWTDGASGAFVLIMALVVLCTCLYLIVKLLKGLLRGRVAVWLHKTVNGRVPDLQLTPVRKHEDYKLCGEKPAGAVNVVIGRSRVIPLEWLSGYLAMAVGMGLTVLVQSSSITTSALTPLVGVGVIRLERMYPTVLGANIGTTVTGLIAAFAVDGNKIQDTLAVAYAHLFFNLTGIAVWYGIPPLRQIPIGMARLLGNITATYRWFPIAYILFAFLLIPAAFVGISVASSALTIVIVSLIVASALFVWGVTYLQSAKPESLPESLRTWARFPLWCRSLEPYDRHCCGRVERWAVETCTCCGCGGKPGAEVLDDSVEIELVGGGGDGAAAAARPASPAPKQGDLAKAAARLEEGTAKGVAQV